MTSTVKRDTATKIRLFRDLFTGLEHIYGTYDPGSGRSWQVKEAVTDSVIYHHLKGNRPYGVYLLAGNRTRAAVADFDITDANVPREFVAASAHYGLAAYTERSKSKGFHVWMFFGREGVLAAKVRRVLYHLLDEVGAPRTEVFPKQDALEYGLDTSGNFINAPLFGKFVPDGRTVFLNTLGTMDPYPNQWDLLEGIDRIPESALDEIIEVNELDSNTSKTNTAAESLGVFQAAPGGLPPCARRMLDEGVTSYQRVSCFRLAVLLRRAGLPFDLVAATLSAWSQKNGPQNGKGLLTDVEVQAQTAAAFLKEYAGFGCEEPAIRPYCDPACPIHARGRGKCSGFDPT